jgi:molybdopterin adenylyltransferase
MENQVRESAVTVRVGVLTVSDRCCRGERADGGGPRLRELVRGLGWTPAAAAVVPDEKSDIRKVLMDWCDNQGLSLVLTTGGTGVAPRDVTPEATRPLLEKDLPGLAELMRREGARRTPFAVLSRAAAGTRGRSLIINLPGNPDGAAECLRAVAGVVLHALSLLAGEDASHRHDGKPRPEKGGRAHV